MTYINCRLTAKNRDQLRNPTLGNRVWATFTCCRDETTSEATLSAHLIAVWSLEPPRVLIPDNNFIGSAVSAQPMVVTDRQTDRQTAPRRKLSSTSFALHGAGPNKVAIDDDDDDDKSSSSTVPRYAAVDRRANAIDLRRSPPLPLQSKDIAA